VLVGQCQIANTHLGANVNQQDPIIRASEISQYAYCARAWWLGRVRGYRSSNLAAMRQGAARHRTHGRAVEVYHLLRRLAVALLVLAVVSLLVWLFLALGG
jgi:CRISPR/Cas system-associated exonuclease Cas4 (RecB family)